MAFLVGRGIADITGEAAECGMLGYGKADQQSTGIHLRLRSRAFVFVDPAVDQRLLIVVNELPLMFDSVHRGVLRRLAERYGDLYTVKNTMLTVTHTHCGPGGYSHHFLYNSTTHGFHEKTYSAIVDGMVEAIAYAHDDVAPATVTLAHGELHDASSNRSPVAFARNPAEDRAFFPEEIDPQTTVLAVEREGGLVGVINWFATHGTSMTNKNTLIGGDNKGYASYHWEKLVEGGDYRGQPDLVAAFAQTNAGDMSPNLNQRPGSGPTEDDTENTRIIGKRQYEAAGKLTAGLARGPGQPLTDGLDTRTVYVDLSEFIVSSAFTGDGRAHRTGQPIAGAAALAGTREGPGFPGFRIGPDPNPFWDGISRHLAYRLSSQLRDAHAPKGLTPLGGPLNRVFPVVQSIVPVQLFRLGQLYLIGIPGEVTITAGLRLRREVARLTGAAITNILVAGYSNAYIHYVTTPEEYDTQCYEGGSTLFGRWELPAFVQIVSGLATAMRDGKEDAIGTPPPDLSAKVRRDTRQAPPDSPAPGRAFGDVLTKLADDYRPGETVNAVFTSAYPNNVVRRGGTYLDVQRADGENWETIADDGDWSTAFSWKRIEKDGSAVTVTWAIPPDTPAGRYRLRCHGDAKAADGSLSEFTGVSRTFQVQQ